MATMAAVSLQTASSAAARSAASSKKPSTSAVACNAAAPIRRVGESSPAIASFSATVAPTASLSSSFAIPPASFGATAPRQRLHARRHAPTVASAATGSAAPQTPAPIKWKGAELKPLAITIASGLLVWFIPPPAGVAANAWQLLAIFLATVVGIITGPLPLGAVALIGLGVSVLTQTLTFAAAFSAFGNEIPWLIALAFFFAKGFIKTGLGNRVAYIFVKLFGKTTLGLSYSLVFSEALLAPAIPSVSARAGGIFLPLVKSLCEACGSRAGDGTERKLGAYIMVTCFQTSIISSAMFLTGMAANPLSVNLASAVIGKTISWTEWAIAGIVPGLLGLVLVPLILYVIYPPEIKSSPDAPKLAEQNLAKMGPMTLDEKIMTATLLLTVGLWVFGANIGIGAVTAAICGLTVLLVTGIVTWKECLGEGVAWDTLTWFAALIAMAGYLNKFGLINWFSDAIVKSVGGMGLAWQPTFLILMLVYFYSHYLFASGAAHIGAMFTAFLSVSVALGTPPYFGALMLCFMSNLMGGLTHYGIGSAPVFYGAGWSAWPKEQIEQCAEGGGDRGVT
eukprot:jgi/Mesvir1/20999/Mv08058-RA.1